MMRISIVTPSLNQREFIEETLESVRLQECAGVEHLVMDGGSTDGTVELLQGLDGDGGWAHVDWVSRRDGGQSEALNAGSAAACGEIVGWLNADDRYRPGCFAHVVKAFEENPEVDVVYGDLTFMDKGGTVQQVRREIEFSRFILLHHRVLYIPTTATFFRRRIFDEGNWVRNELHYAMDYEFFLRLDARGYRFKHIPQVLADFRVHPESKSCNRQDLQVSEMRAITLSFSAVARWVQSPGLRKVVLFGLRKMAGWLRYGRKMMRGAYFVSVKTVSEQ
jgi:glycosyltransferase involved in cell wall biosynthesis